MSYTASGGLKDELHKEFVFRLNSCLKKQNMTQTDLAKRLGVSRQAVSLWFNNNTIPTVPTFVVLADILEISVYELYPTGKKQ